jgi:preprotein translocase subunit SecF
MLRILHDTNFDFIKWWRWAAGITAAFILAGLASFAIRGGVNYSIEFTGGTLMQLQFTKATDAGRIRSTLDRAGVSGAEIQQFGSDSEFTVRAQDRRDVAQQASGAESVAQRVQDALTKEFGAAAYKVVRTEAVGPRVGAELRRNAGIAMLLASLVTLVYLAIRFEWRFGVAAVLSTAHDVLVTLAFIKLLHIEVSLTIAAAILTLLGYSGNDTIIIFDRVRENLKKDRKSPLYDVLNRSINETLPRSVLTHATTLAATLALLLFAGEVIRPFAIVMAFGIFVATFSSIYVASPLLLWIEHKWPRAVSSDKASGKATVRASRTAELPAGERTPRPRPAEGAATR